MNKNPVLLIVLLVVSAASALAFRPAQPRAARADMLASVRQSRTVPNAERGELSLYLLAFDPRTGDVTETEAYAFPAEAGTALSAHGVWCAGHDPATVFVATVHQTHRVWVFSVDGSTATLRATQATDSAPMRGGAAAFTLTPPPQ
ncbi:MAG: hypothetical protein U1E76_17535 [Planctomycetota bacterium]